jgi:hypothetical protein
MLAQERSGNSFVHAKKVGEIMLKKLARNTWFLLFLISIIAFAFSIYRSVSFTGLSTAKWAVYFLGPSLIMGLSFIHLNWFVKLVSIINIAIYISLASFFMIHLSDFENNWHLLLLPILFSFYFTWAALIRALKIKWRLVSQTSLSLACVFCLVNISLEFKFEFINQLFYLSLIAAIITTLLSPLKVQKDKINPEIEVD